MDFLEKCLVKIKRICEKTTFTAKCYALCVRYNELIRYAFFGVATTLFNWIIYLIFSRLCFNFIFQDSFTLSFYNIFSGEALSRTYPPDALIAFASNIPAWFFAVAFSFFVNQRWVFADNSRGLIRLKKLLQFYLFRSVSGVFEIAAPSLLMMTTFINDLVAKIIISVLVILLNYLFTKFVTFKKQKNTVE